MKGQVLLAMPEPWSALDCRTGVLSAFNCTDLLVSDGAHWSIRPCRDRLSLELAGTGNIVPWPYARSVMKSSLNETAKEFC